MGPSEFEELLNQTISSYISKLNTSFIGKIVAVNENKTISIQPVLKRVIDDVELTIPIIEDVEFLQNYSNDGYSSLKFSVDDYVLCISLQRDHSEFFETLEIAPAPNKRGYDIADIVALPYFYSNSKKIEDEITGWSAKSKSSIKLNLNDTCFLEMENDKVKFVCDGIDVLGVLSDTLAALTNATVTTPDGTFNLNNVATFTELKTKIDQIKA
jgi:hypothetical protein